MHLVIVVVDSATIGVQIYPHTLTWFFAGSPTIEVSRPACVIDNVHPPAKEQLTALSIEVTFGRFFKVAALAK